MIWTFFGTAPERLAVARSRTQWPEEFRQPATARPRVADVAYFISKALETGRGDVTVTPRMAKLVIRYLIGNDFTEENDQITPGF